MVGAARSVPSLGVGLEVWEPEGRHQLYGVEGFGGTETCAILQRKG